MWTEPCVLRCGVPRSSVRAFVYSMWHVLVFIVAVPRYPLAFQAMGSRGRGLGLDLGTILPARNGKPVETCLGQRHEVQNIR